MQNRSYLQTNAKDAIHLEKLLVSRDKLARSKRRSKEKVRKAIKGILLVQPNLFQHARVYRRLLKSTDNKGAVGSPFKELTTQFTFVS